jgi:hypothetical protein
VIGIRELRRGGRSRWAIELVLIALVGLTGCRKSLADGAREEFARRHSCPEDRVTVQERDDANAAEIAFGFEEGEPPPEVAADPERLAKWKQDAEEKRTRAEDGASSLGIFEVGGCDTSMLLVCNHPRIPHSRGYSIQPNEVVCREAAASRKAARAERKQEKDERKREKEQRKREKAERKREQAAGGESHENLVEASN